MITMPCDNESCSHMHVSRCRHQLRLKFVRSLDGDIAFVQADMISSTHNYLLHHPCSQTQTARHCPLSAQSATRQICVMLTSAALSTSHRCSVILMAISFFILGTLAATLAAIYFGIGYPLGVTLMVAAVPLFLTGCALIHALRCSIAYVA